MIQIVPALKADLADVLITNELAARPTRLPNYAGEAAALCALANLSADSPRAVLQLLADKVVELTGAHSSGISISEMSGDQPIFRWHANGGGFASCVGSTMPRYNSPCGTVLDRNATLLMHRPERHFPFAPPPPHPIVEVLLVPFCDGNTPIGTVWAMAHDKEKTFDNEDRRLLMSLSSFAASAVKNLKHLDLLEDSKARLIKESQQKTDFLALLSHELRNPMGPILSATELMLLRATPADLSVLNIIARQSKQLLRIIDDLLDVSRAHTNKMELRKTNVNLLDIIDTAIESSRANIASHLHKLRVTQPREAIYLNADSSRMTQVIVNLLNNACRYTPDNGEIAVIIKKADDWVTIGVNDSGIGIPHDMLERVFDMFVQAGTRQAGGLGIGLTLVKCIIELHGGSIHVNSRGENLGSEFVVRLPMEG